MYHFKMVIVFQTVILAARCDGPTFRKPKADNAPNIHRIRRPQPRFPIVTLPRLISISISSLSTSQICTNHEVCDKDKTLAFFVWPVPPSNSSQAYRLWQEQNPGLFRPAGPQRQSANHTVCVHDKTLAFFVWPVPVSSFRL